MRLAAGCLAWIFAKPSRGQAALSLKRHLRCIQALGGSLLRTKV